MLALACIVASSAGAQGSTTDARIARLTGRVADAVGAAIVKAEVLVTNTSLHAETSSDGRFELAGIPAGQVEVIVRRLGFSPAKIALDLGAGEVRDIRVLLSPVAMLMDSVTVTTTAPEIEIAWAGFEARKARGFGTYITRDQIEKKRPRVTTDLFRTVPGTKLMRLDGVLTIVSNRLGVLECPLRLFVDGAEHPLYGTAIDAAVQVVDIGAIEVYAGGATVPPQFAGRESTCGVIAVWTRQGQRKQ